MNVSRWFAAAALLAALPAALPAQLKVGTEPPAFAFDKVWNDGPKSFAEFAGKVVILDFARTW